MNVRKNDHEDVSINIFAQIDDLCREFRKHWKTGTKPKIGDYLKRINENARDNLFRNLLNTEIKLRMRRGESPESSDYLNRFPQFANIIRQEFDESTMGSFELAEGTPEDSAGTAVVEPASALDSEADHTRTYDELAASRLGDYELIRELGRGGFGVVYEARHVKQQNRVALKTLPTGTDGQEVNADRLHKFRKEFRTLSEINHPNLVGMQTLEFDGTQWFFTMDLVKGTDFLSYVRPNDWLDEKHLRSSIKQLAAGIMALHDKGIVHRDLKPSNVLVEPNGRVVILDFGLVAQLQQNPDMTATRSAMFAGTPRYAAPEQMFGERSEASDWYAMGVMLYEALTGAPPFPGRNPMEVLQQKQNEDPPTLRARDDIPTDLATLADTLLRREPSQRASTSHIAQELKLDLESTKHPSAGSTDDEGAELETFPDEEIELIGREEQLSQLEAAKQQFLETRKPVVCWITGLSGEGKSALAEKFLAPIRRGKEMLVLSGRCYDRESVPFKAIDSFIDSLVRFLRSDSAKWLHCQTNEDIEFLAHLFPLLNRVEWIAERRIEDVAEVEPQSIRGRAFYGLRQLLLTISNRLPVVLLVDDLQWADADSAQSWFELLTDQQPPSVFFLGSFRKDEAEDSPFLQTWKHRIESEYRHLKSQTVSVEPLTVEQCVDLASQRTGLERQMIERQIIALHRAIGGNPYLIEQLIQGFDTKSVTFRHLPLDQMITERMKRLPPIAESLLEVIAVSGQPIRINEAANVSNAEQGAHEILTRMRSERLVRLVGDSNDPMVDTWHDKVRESILEGMSDTRKRNLHLKLAEEIESKEINTAADWLVEFGQMTTPGKYRQPPSDRILDLCRHFTESSDARAFVYQWLAAEQAMLAFAAEDSFGFFQQARVSFPPEESNAVQYRFWMGFGQVALWNKKPEVSLKAYQSAEEQASSKFEATRALAGIVSVHARVADLDTTMRFLNLALGRLGIRRPRTSAGRVFSFVEKTLRLLFIPHRWLIARRQEDRKQAQLASSILTSPYHLFSEFGMSICLDMIARLATYGMKSGELSHRAAGCAALASAWSSLGLHWLSWLLMRRVRKIKEVVNDPLVAGFVHNQFGFAEYTTGNLGASKAHYELSLPSYYRCHNDEGIQNCLHMYRHIRAFNADSRHESAAAKALLENVAITGNVQRMCWANYDAACAMARAGDLEDGLLHLQRSNSMLQGERFYQTEPIRASSDAYVRLQCSDYEGAVRLAIFAWGVVGEGWIVHDVSLFFLPVWIEGLAGPRWINPPHVANHKSLRWALRKTKLLYRSIPNHHPHVKRVFGRAYWQMGKSKKAIRNFESAVQLAKEKGMDYQRAKCLLDLAAVKEEGRDENRAEAIELLKKMESVIPRTESWLLGDQYDEAVVAPEFDLEAWEKENGPVTPYLNELEKTE